MPTHDLKGMRFGYLTAIRLDHYHKTTKGRNKAVWECVCDCGNIALVLRDNLLYGSTISCGCYRKKILSSGINKRHGKAHDPLYICWNNKKQKGGVVGQWETFLGFEEWFKESGLNDIPTMIRLDVSKPWSPENYKTIF